ncbi:MAG: hypothetical protein M0Z51_10475 [Propionibacterium sp.]|nr:hypothetical protein [Propionibacterium sp.]
MPEAVSGSRPRRGDRWAARDYPTLLWLTAALVVVIAHRVVPQHGWVLVHLVLLGALTHAVLVWSLHFAQALLRSRPDLDPRAHQSARLWLVTAGAAVVVVGVPTRLWWLVVTGAVLLVAAVTWHAIALGRRWRAALPGRFRVTLRYYLAAAAWVPVGATLGVLLARRPGEEWVGRLVVAHSLSLLLGWIGLTVTGTLVTLWPTMLRTRIDDRAERLAEQALPVFLLAITVLVIAPLAGSRALSVTALVLYLAGLVWWGRALIVPVHQRPPGEVSTMSVSLALVWWVVVLVLAAAHIAHARTWTAVAHGYGTIAAVAAFGFGLQLMVGALSYLIPVVLGGGPSVVRAVQHRVERWGVARIVGLNLAVLTWLIPVPDPVRIALRTFGVVAVALFVPIMVSGFVARVRAMRRPHPGRSS